MWQMTNGLWLHDGCLCAGTGCGGHLHITPIGYQGAAQHTYTRACDGFHEPGPCPRSQQPVRVVQAKWRGLIPVSTEVAPDLFMEQ